MIFNLYLQNWNTDYKKNKSLKDTSFFTAEELSCFLDS